MKKLNEILNAIEARGGSCFYVGGSVRDALLEKPVYDFDIEVYQMQYKELLEVLSKFGDLIASDKFYTVKIKQHPNYEFALPRQEIKAGTYHTDFTINIIEDLNFKLATSRRDFTVNTLMKRHNTNEVIDVHNGIVDLNNKLLRHVGDNFVEDSLRVLRGLRLVSKLGFKIEDETLKLCMQMTDELEYISNQRFSSEISRMIEGEYFAEAITYLILILKDYFNIVEYDISKIERLSSCSDIKVRLLAMFYLIKCSDQQFFINRCTTKTKVRSDINFVIDNLDDFYEIASRFSKEETILLYKFIKNQNVCDLHERFEDLSKKYNAQYFIKEGFSGKDISMKMKRMICEKLKGG